MDTFAFVLLISILPLTFSGSSRYRRPRLDYDSLILTDLVGPDGSGSDDIGNNINKIRFSSARFNLTVPASAEPGYTVGRLTLVEDVSRDYSGVAFQLRSKDDSVSKDYFHLEPKSGVVRVSQYGVALMETHLFIVTATDSNSPESPMALAVLTIDVLTVGNFYTPVFDKMRYRASVAFEVSKGTTILTVRATDKDNDENGRVSYRLLNPTHRNNIFRCKRNGEIANKKVFGVDRIGDYTLIVEGMDGGMPPKKSTTKLKISVYDVRPRFLRTNYTFTISENTQLGSKIGAIEATSWQPSDQKANISYSIIYGGDYFTINQSSGELSVIKRLYNDVANFRLIVRAQQTGFALRTRDTMVILTMDRPSSQKRSFNISISEDKPVGSQIYKFDYNAEVSSYIMVNSSEDLPFRVDKETGDVFTTSVLDRERSNIYAFKILVECESSYVVDMRILIKDVNDNAPIFGNCQDLVQLQDTTVGSEIIRFVVSDADGPLSDLSYRISGNTDDVMKVVKYPNGVSIVIAREIELRLYDITLTASDTVHETLCNISFEVINANTPLFESWIYNALVHEEQDVGKRVLQVHATDKDAGVNGYVTYSTINVNQYFTIDKSTGEIFTVANLDREIDDHHTFNITATDGGEPPRQSWATVNIFVLDVNDNSPRFLNLPYSAEVQENNNNSVAILRVEATDDDNHTFAGITYGLKEDSNSIYFVIDGETGEVKTRQGYSLNRELISEFNLIVTATDGLHQALATILITVTDVDDNPPRIVSPTQYEIEETREIGALIGRVLLSDADEEISMPVRFRLAKPDSKFFSIDMMTGVLVTKRNLRQRNKDVYDRLEVVVTCGQYTIREPLVIYIIRNETLEPITLSPETLTSRNQTSQPTVSYTMNASIPLHDESRDDVTALPVTYATPIVSPGMPGYVNTTNQTLIDAQTTPEPYRRLINATTPMLITEPLSLTQNVTVPSTYTSRKTSAPDDTNCACSYNDDERDLTMKILRAKLETQETELRVRQMERRLTTMKLRYWTQQIKIAEDRDTRCGGVSFLQQQDVIGGL